jgi:hypothetical protein
MATTTTTKNSKSTKNTAKPAAKKAEATKTHAVRKAPVVTTIPGIKEGGKATIRHSRNEKLHGKSAMVKRFVRKGKVILGVWLQVGENRILVSPTALMKVS